MSTTTAQHVSVNELLERLKALESERDELKQQKHALEDRNHILELRLCLGRRPVKERRAETAGALQRSPPVFRIYERLTVRNLYAMEWIQKQTTPLPSQAKFEADYMEMLSIPGIYDFWVDYRDSLANKLEE